MEENKDLIQENEIKEVETQTKPEIAIKNKKLKNQALLKRGGYSIAITALVLASLILFNWLVAVLSDRFNLEFDMSSEKINSISEDNIDYIKSVKDEIDVIVCASEDTYASYMSYYSQSYGVYSASNEYFDQTVTLINKYADYNDRINVRFIDPQSTEFTEISTKYSNLDIAYGDIIVTSKKGDGSEERKKRVGFEDIYDITDDSGYGYYSITGNNIETALTGAIAFAESGEMKKAALITGHSSINNTANYIDLLKANNYEVEKISDSIITAIPDDTDIIVIMSPSIDFIEDELNIISEFLSNKGKLGKGLIYFGDASCPNLPNFNDFLSEWGINVGEGILYETEENNRLQEDPSTMGLYVDGDSGLEGIGNIITGYNIPITTSQPVDSTITVTELVTTTETVVVAPIGATADWSDYTNDDKGQFVSAAKSEMLSYDKNNERICSYVMTFSSVQFIQSDWAEYAQLSNKNLVLECTDIAAGVTESNISFISKTITNESYADKVTVAGLNTIRVIFMVILPVLTLVLGIYIFFRRKNS